MEDKENLENVKAKKENEKVKEERKVEKSDEPKFKKATTETLKKENKKASNKEEKVKKNKQQGETKKRKSGPWIGGGIVLLIVALILVTAFIILPNTPEKTIEGFFNCLKIGDFESITKYVINTEDIEDQEEINSDDMSQEAKQLFFNKIEWNILNITKENDIAKVEVELTNKDFKTIMTNCMKKIVQTAIEGQDVSEEKQKEYLLEQLKDESIQTVKETIKLELQKQDGKWKIKMDENTVLSLLPGFEEAMNSVEKLFD